MLIEMNDTYQANLKSRMFAFVADPLGVIIQYALGDPQTSDPSTTCYPSDPNHIVSTYLNFGLTAGLYFNPLLPSYFYVAISIPASIYELDISDPYNIHIFKYYGI